MYNMTVYLSRDSELRNTWLQLTWECQNWQRKYKDVATQTVYGQLLLPRLIQWLGHKTNLLLWHCQTQQEGHAIGLGPKRMTLQWGGLQVQTGGGLTAVLWRDKRDVRILTNIHDAPVEGNFCDSKGKAIKPQIVADHNCRMARRLN
jgi:hypothetical protein